MINFRERDRLEHRKADVEKVFPLSSSAFSVAGPIRSRALKIAIRRRRRRRRRRGVPRGDEGDAFPSLKRIKCSHRRHAAAIR